MSKSLWIELLNIFEDFIFVNDKFPSRLSDPHGFEAINICMKTPIFLPWRNINIRIPGSLWKKGRDGTNIVNCKILSRFSFIANIWHLNFYSCQEVGSRGAACVFWVDRAVDPNLYLQLLCLDNDICWHCAHAMSSLSTQVVSANSSLTNIWLG